MSDLEELKKASILLQDFAAAMAKWEQECWEDRQRNPVDRMDRGDIHAASVANCAKCKMIFKQYCTDRPRPYARPEAAHFDQISTYAPPQFVIDRAEFDKSRRIHIFTKEGAAGRYRFTIVKKKEGLRIDDRHSFLNGEWTPAEL